MRKDNRQKPTILILRAINFILHKRVHFEKGIIGKVIHEEDDFEIFRKVILDPEEGQLRGPGVIMKVKFVFKNLSGRVNKKLSLIPIPFIISQPGFRSKTWMLGKKSGWFQGVYEWDTAKNAEKYWNSFPMKLMKRRAIFDSLYYEILEKNR